MAPDEAANAVGMQLITSGRPPEPPVVQRDDQTYDQARRPMPVVRIVYARPF
jgi:hypothetical protein